MQYGYKKRVTLPFDEAIRCVTDALANEGFGVLMDLDIQAKLQEKLGKDIGRYRILGACNPSFAAQSLESEKEIGLLLPCNVIVYEETGQVVVSAVLPTVAMAMVENTALAPIAQEVEVRLRRAVDSLIEN